MDDRPKRQIGRRGRRREKANQPSTAGYESIPMSDRETGSGEEKSPGLKVKSEVDDSPKRKTDFLSEPTHRNLLSCFTCRLPHHCIEKESQSTVAGNYFTPSTQRILTEKEEDGPDDGIIESETEPESKAIPTVKDKSEVDDSLKMKTDFVEYTDFWKYLETIGKEKEDFRRYRNLHDMAYKEIDFNCNKEESRLSFITHAFGEKIVSFVPRTLWDPNIAQETEYRSCVFNKLSILEILLRISYSIDAFGEVKFVGYSDEVAKFFHVNFEDHIRETIFKMRVQWELPLPKLLISVTGGRNELQLNSHLKKALGCGLVKAARSTDVWILTTGLHAGVAKYIGEAIHDNECSSTGNKVVTIGIASWDSVQNKESLENCMGRLPAKYDISNETDTETCALDPNHSHFILVHNQQNVDGGTLLRKELETAFSDDKIEETKDGIPSIVIMIEGEPGTLKSVFDSLSRGIPVIIVKGSGGAADFMAYAYQRVIEIGGGENNIRLDGNQEKQLEIDLIEKCKGEFENNSVIDYTDLVKQMLDSLKKETELITLFDIDSDEDFDVTILKALFKVNNDDLRNLQLAFEWDICDIAKSEIFQKDPRFKSRTDRWHQVMKLALRKDRIDFVKFFMEHGVNLREFSTEEHIKDLYEMQEVRIYTDSQIIYSSHIESALSEMETDRLPRVTQLLKWAVLFNKEELIFQCWEVSLGALPTALVVNKLLKVMHEECKDYGYKSKLQEQAKLYEERANDVLTECYSADVQKTIDLLLLKREMWDNVSCMEIASKVKNETFMSHEACQSLLTKIWMGSISEKTSFWKMIFCALCPLFMFLIKFDDEQNDRKNTNKSNSCKQHGKYYRCLSFYNSPRIQFLGNLIFYIIFLLIYSYVLVVEHQPQFSNLEWLLFVWLIGIFTEEIRQVLSQKSSLLKSKFLIYMRDAWNIIDVITIILYITGTTLRFLKLYEAAKVILSLNLISFYLRFLYMLSAHKELGPKLIMIKKMMQGLGYFIIILFVFMIAYGVASQSILYSNSPAPYDLFKAVFKKAYLHMHAELFLEEYEEYSNCNGNNGTCPSEISTYIVLILMCLYILLTNILLLNLLIAMFSYTFQQVQEKSQFHWSFQRYNLSSEFYTRSPLPPPFILLSHIYQFCRYLYQKARHLEPNTESAFAQDFDKFYESKLLTWERKMVKTYLSRKNKSDSNLKDVIDKLTLKVDESQHNMQLKIDNMDKTLKLLREKLLNTK